MEGANQRGAGPNISPIIIKKGNEQSPEPISLP